MSRSAPKKNATEPASPPVNGVWGLQVTNENLPDLGLQMLNYIEITEPAPDGPQSSISGYVMAAFPITNGSYIGDSVSFSASILGVNYDFTGTVTITVTPAGEERKINGTISSASNSGSRTPNTEDASWSAQAQGGGGEDDEERGGGRHFGRAHRASR